jgi:serine/threonine-protein kinase
MTELATLSLPDGYIQNDGETIPPTLDIDDELVNGRFVVTGVMRARRYAEVYSVIDQINGDGVIVKILHEPDEELASCVDTDREVLVHQLLDGCLGIVPLRQVGVLEKADGIYKYIATEQAKSSLSRIIDRKCSLAEAPSLVVHAATDISAGLRSMGNFGLVHCDIKPSNVLLSQAGRYTLTDFGATRFCGETNGKDFYGTLGYMAPECAEADVAIDAAADIFGFGTTLYNAATKTMPYGEGIRLADYIIAVRTKAPIPPSSLNGKVPKLLDSLIMGCIESAPSNRATLDEVESQLQMV